MTPQRPDVLRPPETATYSCSGVSVDFADGRRRRRVLDDLGFTVAKGEFLSIVGASGTGKTTLLRILGGLLPAAEGSAVHYHGEPVTSPPDGVVIVFQNYTASLLAWRTVERNVALGIEGTMPAADRRERVAAALELVGLSDRGRDYVWQLSGGMQQRVQIARALAMRPEVLLMDEPFGALDAMTKALMQDELQRVREVTGATVVFVTHDIDEAVYLSDRILVLHGSPARITAEIGVDLPRRRDQIGTKELPRYLELRHQIYQAIRGTGAGDGT